MAGYAAGFDQTVGLRHKPPLPLCSDSVKQNSGILMYFMPRQAKGPPCAWKLNYE